MITLIIEALFLPVWVCVLAAYRHDRSQIQRDVILIFTAMAVFFVRDLWRELVGPLPSLVNDAASALLFAQPVLTLRLVTRFRPVPGWVLRSALAAYIANVVLLFGFESPLPAPALIVVVSSFAVSGLAASAFLAVEARRRSGSPRVRLAIAAFATCAFALALVTVSLGRSMPDLQDTMRAVARGMGLISTLGFAAAFVPPSRLRRLWSATALYAASQRLLRAPATETANQTWQRYVETAREVCGTDGAIVLLEAPSGAYVETACAGHPADQSTAYPAAEIDLLLARPQPITVRAGAGDVPTIAATYARREQAAFVRAVPLRRLPEGRGLLILLSQHGSLFTEDDIALLADLGSQAGILAERGSVLAEQERLSAELSDLVAALTLANQAKSDFMANMSHELRTPLNAIIGFSELMKGEDAAGDRRYVPADWIDHVHSSGRHLLDLINDILDLAKIEAGRLDLRPEPLDLPTAVTDAVSALRPLAVRKHLRVTCDLPAVIVHADRMRFRQILDNLLSNAIKFTPDEGQIEVSAVCVRNEVRITVSDTGVGIAKEDQARVFEEFQQVGDRSSQQAGTGLGLALTRRLVEAHGGRIEVESRLGHGSRFTVSLKSTTAKAQPAGAASPGTHRAVSHSPRGGILLIEDEPSAVRLLRTYLEEAGYHVSVATDGPAGLAAAKAAIPDAIILDVILPGIDGWEVLRHLKVDERLRDVPVVIVTVVDEQEVGMALGAVDYFVKPINRAALLDRLARHALLPSGAPTRPASVLVVDDDQASLEIVKVILSQQGARVVTATTGVDGLRHARSTRFDLILCDLLMPDIDGFTVVAALNGDPTTRQTPVLIVTAHELTEPDKDRLNGKILGVVRKGDELLDGLRHWLAQVTRPTHEMERAK